MGACLGASAAGPGAAGVVPSRDPLSIDEIRVQLAEKRKSEGLPTLALGGARSTPSKKLPHQRTKHTFQVVVDVQPGDYVGAVLSNLAGESSGAVVVFLREGGLLNAWNKSFRTALARVCVGDVIVKANDAVGFWNILEECRKPGMRVLTLERRRFGQDWRALLFRLRLVMRQQLQVRVSQVCFWERKAADDGSRGRSGKSGGSHSAPSRSPQSARAPGEGWPNSVASSVGRALGSRLEQRPQLMQLSRASADDDVRCLLCKGGAGGQASLAQMPCGHAFHNSCICKWMSQNEPRCPECSANLSDTLLGIPFAVEDCV